MLSTSVCFTIYSPAFNENCGTGMSVLYVYETLFFSSFLLIREPCVTALYFSGTVTEISAVAKFVGFGIRAFPL